MNFRLRDAIREKIEGHRRQAMRNAFLDLLDSQEVTVDPEACFEYPGHAYPANPLYEGPHTFRKHFYERPGLLNHEEVACAIFLDSLPGVQYWVRNLEKSLYSFWLPIPTGRFYPDFVAKLTDQRILVVEYKGSYLMDTADTKMKKMVEDRWAVKSSGRCAFRLVAKSDFEDLLRAAVATS